MCWSRSTWPCASPTSAWLCVSLTAAVQLHCLRCRHRRRSGSAPVATWRQSCLSVISPPPPAYQRHRCPSRRTRRRTCTRSAWCCGRSASARSGTAALHTCPVIGCPTQSCSTTPRRRLLWRSWCMRCAPKGAVRRCRRWSPPAHLADNSRKPRACSANCGQRTRTRGFRRCAWRRSLRTWRVSVRAPLQRLMPIRLLLLLLLLPLVLLLGRMPTCDEKLCARLLIGASPRWGGNPHLRQCQCQLGIQLSVKRLNHTSSPHMTSCACCLCYTNLTKIAITDLFFCIRWWTPTLLSVDDRSIASMTAGHRTGLDCASNPAQGTKKPWIWTFAYSVLMALLLCGLASLPSGFPNRVRQSLETSGGDYFDNCFVS